MTVLLHVLTSPLYVAWAADPDPDPAPTDNAVKAGYVAFTIFLLLIVAIALLGFSLSRHLRKVAAAKAAGVFGDEPESSESPVSR